MVEHVLGPGFHPQHQKRKEKEKHIIHKEKLLNCRFKLAEESIHKLEGGRIEIRQSKEQKGKTEFRKQEMWADPALTHV